MATAALGPPRPPAGGGNQSKVYLLDKYNANKARELEMYILQHVKSQGTGENAGVLTDNDKHLPYISEITRHNLQMPVFLVEAVEKEQYIYKFLVDDYPQVTLHDQQVLNWCRETVPLYVLRTIGDGNCLLHAASVGMWGMHDHNLVLRELLYTAMAGDGGDLMDRWKKAQAQQNGALQLRSVDLSSDWDHMVALASPEKSTDMARLPYQSLEDIHIFVLAQILRRPIVVLSDAYMRNMRGSVLAPNHAPGIYLPLLWPPEKCVRAPLVLAYFMNHFSPLVPVSGFEKHVFAVPLLNSASESLCVHYMSDREESQVSQKLEMYLDLIEIPVPQGIPVLAAKLSKEQIPPHLNLMTDFQNKFEENWCCKQEQKRAALERERQLAEAAKDVVDDDNDNKTPTCITKDCKFFGSTENGGRCSACQRAYVMMAGPRCQFTGCVNSMSERIDYKPYCNFHSYLKKPIIPTTEEGVHVTGPPRLLATVSALCRIPGCKYKAQEEHDNLCQQHFTALDQARQLAEKVKVASIKEPARYPPTTEDVKVGSDKEPARYPPTTENVKVGSDKESARNPPTTEDVKVGSDREPARYTPTTENVKVGSDKEPARYTPTTEDVKVASIKEPARYPPTTENGKVGSEREPARYPPTAENVKVGSDKEPARYTPTAENVKVGSDKEPAENIGTLTTSSEKVPPPPPMTTTQGTQPEKGTESTEAGKGEVYTNEYYDDDDATLPKVTVPKCNRCFENSGKSYFDGLCGNCYTTVTIEKSSEKYATPGKSRSVAVCRTEGCSEEAVTNKSCLCLHCLDKSLTERLRASVGETREKEGRSSETLKKTPSGSEAKPGEKREKKGPAGDTLKKTPSGSEADLGIMQSSGEPRREDRRTECDDNETLEKTPLDSAESALKPTVLEEDIETKPLTQDVVPEEAMVFNLKEGDGTSISGSEFSSSLATSESEVMVSEGNSLPELRPKEKITRETSTTSISSSAVGKDVKVRCAYDQCSNVVEDVTKKLCTDCHAILTHVKEKRRLKSRDCRLSQAVCLSGCGQPGSAKQQGYCTKCYTRQHSDPVSSVHHHSSPRSSVSSSSRSSARARTSVESTKHITISMGVGGQVLIGGAASGGGKGKK